MTLPEFNTLEKKQKEFQLFSKRKMYFEKQNFFLKQKCLNAFSETNKLESILEKQKQTDKM